MTNTIVLKNNNFQELTQDEMMLIDGGDALGKFIWGAAVIACTYATVACAVITVACAIVPEPVVSKAAMVGMAGTTLGVAGAAYDCIRNSVSN